MDDPPPRRDAVVHRRTDRRSRKRSFHRSARSSRSSRSSRDSATRSATRSAARCCRRSPAPPSRRSGSTGVLHEFSTVPKVTEDVTDIILNLKELVVRSDLEEPTTMYLKAKGPAEVTAGDIAPPAGVEILNSDLHVATIGKGAIARDGDDGRARRRLPHGRQEQEAARSDRRDPGRLDLLAGAQGQLHRREHACRADDRPRPADPRRRDRRLGHAARGARLGRRHAARARATCSPTWPRPRASRSARPRTRSCPSDYQHHDRGAQPVGALLQLPEARGHQHGRRPGAEVRVRADGHPQLRAEVDRRGQGSSSRSSASACGRSEAGADPQEGTPAGLRPGSPAADAVDACQRSCSSTRASTPPRPRPSCCAPTPRS